MNNFKAGDWVDLVRCDGIVFDTFQYAEGYTCSPGYSIDPWQPKEGEWCWFWNDGFTVHAKFSRKENDTYIAQSVDMRGNCYYEYCEPFIGTLPSLEKEN